MKTVVTLLLLTVICFQCYNCGPVAPGALFRQCCTDSTRSPIPKGRVKHVAPPQSACNVKAMIVTTVCGNRTCIDADWKWSKKLLAEFEKSTANNLPPSAPFNVAKCEDVRP
ncbi:hypothetical protein D9C73_004542 [Collichthys lucidus]|uniref:Chemokine interleukin-8-like domain-containing protein n=1 Tax=Collichthys lucidus TaxID=240159 RepID=A0A4U5U838_COLLU|nr:hypothetical protein D9C73_004542 [Collichthys lucidus]